MKLYEKTKKAIEKLESKFSPEILKMNPFEQKLYSIRYFNDRKGSLFKQLNDLADTRLIIQLKNTFSPNIINILKNSEFNYYWLYEIAHKYKDNRIILIMLNAISNINTAQHGRYK